MLVDVVPMRVKGEKLSRDAIRSLRPVRGALTISDRLDMHNARRVLLATLCDENMNYLLPVLDHVNLTRWSGNSFVLAGLEEVVARRKVELFQQSWWVRLGLSDSNTAPLSLRGKPLEARSAHVRELLKALGEFEMA